MHLRQCVVVTLLTITFCFSVVLSVASDSGSEKKESLMSLKYGILWSPGNNERDIKRPMVKKVNVPELKIPGIKPLGTGYQIDMDSDLKYPVTVAFPIPDSIGEDYDKLVFVKLSNGKRSFQYPYNIDKKGKRAHVLCRSFSTFFPSLWDIDYFLANIGGEIIMTASSDEQPEKIYFDMTSTEIRSGGHANFVQVVDGLGPFTMFMPIPHTHYGSYVFQRIIGYSNNFLFSGDPEVSPPLNVNGASSNYNVTLKVIPVTSILEGRVVDEDESPLENIIIELFNSEGVSYNTRSHAGGKYRIEMIGLTNPRESLTETMTYHLSDPEDEQCSVAEGSVSLTAGRTLDQDLIYRQVGEIRGNIRDKNGVILDGPTVIVEDSNGETYTRKDVLSPFFFEDIPVGVANVTVICPDGQNSQTQTIEVTCDYGDDLDLTNFVIDCSEGRQFYITHTGSFESDSRLHITKAATDAEFSIFLPKGETEASTIVTYPIEHVIRGKASNDPQFKFSSNNFTLKAQVRWTVSKTTNRYGVSEYGFHRETLDRQMKKMKVVISGKGTPQTVDIGVEAMLGPTLMSPKAIYLKKGKKINEFPFSKRYTFSDKLPQAPGGIPGGYINESNSHYRSKITIETKR